MGNSVNLSSYNNDWFKPGRNFVIRTLWFITNSLFLISSLQPSSKLRVVLLRLFGAKIGKGVVIKPGVNIKYPWNLTVGNYCWIGERVWIDSLTKVQIGENCCLSQGVIIITGNHNYKEPTFDLIVNPVVLEDGCWLGVGSVVTDGVTCGTHSVLSAGSVASKDLEPYYIYRGNPAEKIRKRIINSPNKN